MDESEHKPGKIGWLLLNLADFCIQTAGITWFNLQDFREPPITFKLSIMAAIDDQP